MNPGDDYMVLDMRDVSAVSAADSGLHFDCFIEQPFVWGLALIEADEGRRVFEAQLLAGLSRSSETRTIRIDARLWFDMSAFDSFVRAVQAQADGGDEAAKLADFSGETKLEIVRGKAGHRASFEARSFRRAGGVAVLTLAGDLDGPGLERLRDALVAFPAPWREEL